MDEYRTVYADRRRQDLSDEQIRRDIAHHMNRVVHILLWAPTADERAQLREGFQAGVWGEWGHYD